MPDATHFSTATHEYDPMQEVRFAVVIYGGVSLAIYINGVVQEMLRLVRATAPGSTEGEPLIREPKGSERVYRKLRQVIGDPDRSAHEVNEDLKKRKPCPIRTRFVIDVLSGTSAGGINAIFLAKALANNQKLDQLQSMWIEEGDIDELINDKRSLKPLKGRLSGAEPSAILTEQPTNVSKASQCPRRHGWVAATFRSLTARGQAGSLLHGNRHCRPDTTDRACRWCRGGAASSQRVRFSVPLQGPGRK